MKIGVCGWSVEQLESIKKNGYDYIEMSFAGIVSLTDEQFEKIKTDVEKSVIKAEITNCHFPGDFQLYAYDEATGEATEDFAEIEKNVREYNELGFARASQLGVKVAVVGSGKARRIPENMKREVAEAQFGRVLEICGEVAAKYGAEIVIEPLNSAETNFINTLSEGVELCKKINSPYVSMLNDFYHSMKENEPVESLANAGKLLKHTHICTADRCCPTLENDGSYLLPLVKALKETGYDGRMSLECKFLPDFDTAIANARSLADEIRKI